MKTRRQAASDHSPINRVPVEVLTQILKYDCISHSDLRAISSTNRYLRSVVSPLLFQEVEFVVRSKASFEPLAAIARHQQRGELLRVLTIEAPGIGIPWNTATASSRVLLAALPSLVNLSAISFPFSLLTNEIFELVYRREEITTLGITDAIYPSDQRIHFNSLVSLPPRTSPLVVPELNSGRGVPAVELAERFIRFLGIHSIVVTRFFIVFAFGMTPTIFTSDIRPNLRSLWLIALPSGFTSARTFFEDVAEFQGQSDLPIEFIYLTFGDYQDGFELAKAYPERPPSLSFREAWDGARAREVEIEWYYPGDDAGAYMNIGVSTRFLEGTILSPTRFLEFARLYEYTYHFTFSAERCDLRWSDWDETLELIPTSLPILGVLDLVCSITPLPTVSITLACSPECYLNLSLVHPSLHRDSELVGGYAMVWTASFALNLARIKQLGPRFDRKGDRKVDWWMRSPNGWIVNMAGVFGLDGQWESWDDELGSTPVKERISNCYCFGCGDAKVDPLTALRACGVKEVRTALASEGFDFEAFDARPPTSPIDRDSFETFLRSAT